MYTRTTVSIFLNFNLFCLGCRCCLWCQVQTVANCTWVQEEWCTGYYAVRYKHVTKHSSTYSVIDSFLQKSPDLQINRRNQNRKFSDRIRLSLLKVLEQKIRSIMKDTRKFKLKTEIVRNQVISRRIKVLDRYYEN